ncbi:MAG: ThuA domain-containing protein, partial [Myxococcota bacterium]|nr:ThuA domain-containing protein [Myxococcota bacterium]
MPTESPSAGPAPRVLILLPAAGPVHGESEAVAAAVEQIARQAGFEVTQARISESIDEARLAEFRALVFVHGAAAHASLAVRRELLRFVEAGGGAVFVHAPLPPGNDWGTARRWLGLRRAEHGATRERRLVRVAAPGERESDLTIETGWHRFSDLFAGSEVVVRDAEDEPVAWRRRVGTGKIFASDLGHDVASLASEFATGHFETGIRWAAEGAPLDYSHTSPRVGSFSKQVLVTNVSEPIALALFPDRSGRLLFTERRGSLKLYEPGSAEARVVAELEVDAAGESGL